MAMRRIETKYVRRFIKGEPHSFEYIFEFYKAPIYSFAFSIVKNKDDAEEVLQETFIKTIQKIEDLKNIKSFHTWLFTIAYREANQVFRKHKNKIQLDDTIFENIESEENVERIVENKALQLVIEKAIQDLPQDLIEITYLRYIEELKMKEISKVLEMPLGTVKSKLNRAKIHLQKDLQSNDILPKEYISASTMPLIIEVLKGMYTSQGISSEVSKQILTNSISSNQAFLGKNITKNNISTFSKAALSISVIATIAYGAYLSNTNTINVIKDILYIQDITNSNIEVTVLTSKDIQDSNITITEENKEIAYVVEDKKIKFEVIKNGDYTVNIDDTKEKIVIDNIDKEYPILLDTKYENNILSFKLEDNLSGIDYEKSYIVDKNKEMLPKDFKINNIESNEILIVVYDKVGNMVEYEIHIDELIKKDI